MAVYTYDPSKVAVIVGGIPISGFADGESIKVERTVDTYNKSTGLDGKTSRVKTNDKSGTITLVLAQTSPSNDTLSIQAAKDSDEDVVTVTIEDVQSGSSYTSATCWIKKPANAGFSKDITNREWIFEAVDLDMNTKGFAQEASA